MLNLRELKHNRITVLGGGAAGWFAAIALRNIFGPKVEIRLVESSKIGIVGVGEGGLLNFAAALKHYDIKLNEFLQETKATFKWGFSYEGWRSGKKEDCFYHLFASPYCREVHLHERGCFPYLSAMIGQEQPLERIIKGSTLIKNNASQEEAFAFLKNKEADISTSFHFDSYKLASYLKKVALSRGVKHQDAVVEDIVFDANGHVTALQTENESIVLDFLIDASGLSRKVISRMKSPWHSFKDYLLMDSAIPFYMPHPRDNPMLVSRAIAMKAGWMWQIPLQHRVGAGYVFSSQFMDEQQAIAEIEAKLGFAIEPQNMLRFEPGCFELVWQGNVMALGLSSGFVEPLEATSIGQMLEQLRNFERVLLQSQGIISERTIREFNEANFRSWLGIRDFLRMHYDNTRTDTAFWQAAAEMPVPESYREIQECWQERTPGILDVGSYAIHNWWGIFHPVNWMFVAAPLGLINPHAGLRDLNMLSAETRDKALQFAAALQQAG